MIKRGTNYNDIYNYRNSRHFINTVKEANQYLLNKENVDLILITGSLYLASEYRNMLTEE